MAEKKILCPYNFTVMDKKALDYLVDIYAESEKARITLFHLYPPIPDIVISRNSVMDRMSGSLHYLRTQSEEQENKIIEVRQVLLDNGFKTDQVDYLYLPKKRDISQEICTLVRDKGYDTVVLNRSGRVAGFFKASVFNKVITSLKDVCIVVVT